MGWFDEQIRQRIQKDDEMFADVFVQMTNLVSNQKMERNFTDNRQPVEEALGDILEFYHVKAQEVPESIKNMEDMLEFLLRPSGIMRRSVTLLGDWYKDAVGPMLGTKKDGSIIAILPGKAGGYFYKDYKTDTVIKVNKKNADEIMPTAICFYRPFPLRKMTLWDFLTYIFVQIPPKDYVAILCMTVVCTVLGMVTPSITRYLYGTVIYEENTIMLAGVILTLLCATISGCLFATIKRIYYANIYIKMKLMVESATMMRVLSLPADFFKKYSAGELSDRIGYMGSLCNILCNTIFSIGLTAIFSLIYLGQVATYTPTLAVPAVAVISCIALLSCMTAIVQMYITEKRMEEAGKESGIVFALLSGITKIKNAGAEKRAFAKWGRQYIKVATCSYKLPLLLKWNKTIMTAIFLSGTFVIYYIAMHSGVAVADYMAFNSAYGMMSGAFTALAGAVLTAAQIRPILKMVKPILEAQPEVEKNRQVVTKLRGSIEMNNVTFRYQEEMSPVLNNFSLKIRPGQYVAIVGKTGCGKSTLLRILLGFEKPQRGAVYYDGKDLSSMDLKSLRRNIGVVMQNGKLFQGDIYSNITISAPQLTLEEAWDAAQSAGIAEDIRKMPMGMHTLITEGQGGISGGQRQRLMIARAIAAKPKILMFDEATSALDNIAQKTVSETLHQMKCTKIVIAHRLSTIKQCDRIVVLDHGKIVEDGSYDELLRKKGYFTELAERQQIF